MNIDHRALLSGESTGLMPIVARAALRAASLLYGVAARYRRYQYDHGRKSVMRAGVPVISVGNLTTGGTGKTPVVCDLCVRLRSLGYRVAIVSRGYGAGESGVNDEAMEMAERLSDVPHVQHPDRVEAARIAVEELDVEVIVMDDGFQHRRLDRDLDIVLVDATCPFGFEYLLPRGYLREPINSLERADLVVLTRTDQASQESLFETRSKIQQLAANLPLLETVHRPASIEFERGGNRTIDYLRGRSVGLVSAIGNPDAFEQSVKACGGVIVDHLRMPDHDSYGREVRAKLGEWVDRMKEESKVDLVLCTHKDHVKLAVDQISGVPLGYLRIDLEIQSRESEELLDRLLGELMTRS